MSETTRILTETVFNIAYLAVIWWLVITMWRHRVFVAPRDLRTADRIMWAFAFLGFGDIGHVGFRVVSFAMGGLDVPVTILGKQVLLAPLGSLSTAITFTIFYALLIMAWRERYNKPYGALGYFLFILAIIRLIIMTHPDNGWQSLQAVQPWSLYRNLPLMLIQVGLAYLILRDASAANDRTFIWIGRMILVSFACYAPVIFFQQQVPQIGMLMIPKTMAYLVMAFLAFFEFYKVKTVSGLKPTTAKP
mgnify:CR=1 FL=1